MTLLRKVYLVAAAIISLSGCCFRLFVEFNDYFTYQVDDNLQLSASSSSYFAHKISVDICYVQEEPQATVDAIWGKIAEPDQAVKVTSGNSTVTKYIRQNMACYSIESEKKVSQENLGSKGVQFEAEIKSSDAASKELKIILHSSDTLPSDRSSQVAFLPRSFSGERKDLMVTVSFFTTVWYTLPAPYVTNCKIGFSRAKCVEKCVDQKTKVTFGKESTSKFVVVKNKSTEALKDFTVGDIRACERFCNFYDCRGEYNTPLVQSVVPNTGDKVTLLESDTPVLIQRSIPKLTVSELFSNITFTLLFWTMISPVPLLIIETTVKTLFRAELDTRKKKRLGAMSMSVDEDKGSNNNNVTPVTSISNIA